MLTENEQFLQYRDCLRDVDKALRTLLSHNVDLR